jgi:two-component system cell cycle response regulator DivK
MAEILIIDDDHRSIELVALLLRTSGYHPLVAEDGAAGLELACHAKPKLILCDIQLPIIDGYEVARQLKSHADLSPIPVVAVTACVLPGVRERALAAGFDGYLTKPIIPNQFVSQIEGFLSRSAPADKGLQPHPHGVGHDDHSDC